MPNRSPTFSDHIGTCRCMPSALPPYRIHQDSMSWKCRHQSKFTFTKSTPPQEICRWVAKAAGWLVFHEGITPGILFFIDCLRAHSVWKNSFELFFQNSKIRYPFLHLILNHETENLYRVHQPSENQPIFNERLSLVQRHRSWSWNWHRRDEDPEHSFCVSQIYFEDFEGSTS